MQPAGTDPVPESFLSKAGNAALHENNGQTSSLGIECWERQSAEVDRLIRNTPTPTTYVFGVEDTMKSTTPFHALTAALLVYGALCASPLHATMLDTLQDVDNRGLMLRFKDARVSYVDEFRSVSEAIHVNIVGYTPDAP